VIGLDVSSIIPPEYSMYIDRAYEMHPFKTMEGLTMIPSIVMAIFTGRLGILWLLNVLFLVCVPVSVSRLSQEKGKVSV
jgi:hypothetical protein